MLLERSAGCGTVGSAGSNRLLRLRRGTFEHRAGQDSDAATPGPYLCDGRQKPLVVDVREIRSTQRAEFDVGNSQALTRVERSTEVVIELVGDDTGPHATHGAHVPA